MHIIFKKAKTIVFNFAQVCITFTRTGVSLFEQLHK